MVVNYSKIFTVTNVISGKPVTFLVEARGPNNAIAISTLEGEYYSMDEFDMEYKHPRNSNKIKNFIPLTVIGAQKILDSLNEAIQASG